MGMGLWKNQSITFWTRIGVKQHATDLFQPDHSIADPNAGCKLRKQRKFFA
jgi:hypothetical protein